MPRQLLRLAKADPCGLIAAALDSQGDTAPSCSKYREENGDLLVDVVLHDGKQSVSVLPRARRCPGDYVGADKRPARKKREVSFLSVDFRAIDDVTLDFESWFEMYELLPSGKIDGVVGGCLWGDAGRVRFVNGKWVPIGSRDHGCSE